MELINIYSISIIVFIFFVIDILLYSEFKELGYFLLIAFWIVLITYMYYVIHDMNKTIKEVC